MSSALTGMCQFLLYCIATLLLLGLPHSTAFLKSPVLNNKSLTQTLPSTLNVATITAPTQSNQSLPPQPLPQALVIYPDESSPSFFTTKPLQEAVSWKDVLRHIQVKLTWEAANDKFDASQGQLYVETATVAQIAAAALAAPTPSPLSVLQSPVPIIVLIGLGEDEFDVISKAVTQDTHRRAIVTLNCSQKYQTLQRFGEYRPAARSYVGLDGSSSSDPAPIPTPNPIVDFIQNIIGGADRKRDVATYQLVHETWNRRSSEDLLFMLLVLIHSYSGITVASVVAATSSEKTGLKQLACMCTNCGSQMVECISDPTCKKALDCLDKCKSNDQVCSYRCITSYETDKFERFAQCILQKNNCMGNSATIPMTPDPAPLLTFRSQPLTFAAAEDIFIGHLRPREGETNALLDSQPKESLSLASWMVVCGVNPAYDYFSDQHQIFYREKTRPKIMWYDPVFKVTTLDGVQVRHVS